MQMHVSTIFWLSPKSFDHQSNREFRLRDTSIHMFSKPSCCTNYNTSSNAGFEEVTVLITIWINRSEYPIDSSIATYCSQPFEFFRNILYDKSILMSSLMFTFIPYNFEVIGNIMRSEERRVGKECRSR